VKLMRDLVGATLSERYRLMTRIAGGGMGEVYRGHDLLLDRAVAVKLLQPSLAADPDIVDRFRAEARAAARLTHPNVVAVHDWGSEDDRTYYMVMEYVAGTDLRDVLVSRGKVEPAQAAEIVASVCDALSLAHSVGLVHRDVKPENILMARNGTVKVADFGIAAIADSNITLPGAIPGTLRYLAPEQAEGTEATKASDIWAAGAVLAELLTGIPPLHGSGAELLRRRALEEVAPPSQVDASVPKELDEVVLKACARRPETRYLDAADMGQELRSIAMRSLDDAPALASLLDQVTGEVRLPDMEPTTHSRRHMRGKRRRSQRILRALIAVVMVAVLAIGGATAAPFLFGPSMVDVPGLTGLNRAQAASEARALGLHLEVEARKRDPNTPRGEIISQKPASGEIEEGSTLLVVVSAGPPLARVPELIGLTRREARKALERKHLELGEVSDEFSMKEPGTVIEVDALPGAGKLEWGDAVDVVVSRGPEPVQVPSVVELKAAKAKQALAAAGFVPVLADAYSNQVPAGRVISTDPPAGAVADEKSEIQVYVSIGPQYEKVTMPDVRNMTLDKAKARLAALGLRVRVERSCPGNMVVDTHPIAGTNLRENDLVALFVC
jgi:eukaryotic-like serine/threonine-protein kinase